MRTTDISSGHYTRSTRYVVVEICTLCAKNTKVWENSTGNSFWVGFLLSELGLDVANAPAHEGSPLGTC